MTTTTDQKTCEKMFPIQSDHRYGKPHPMNIPWSVAERAYSVYAAQYGRGQSLERLAERGGFGPGEMDMLLPGWQDECVELLKLRSQVVDLRAELEAARRPLTAEEIRTVANAAHAQTHVTQSYATWVPVTVRTADELRRPK